MECSDPLMKRLVQDIAASQQRRGQQTVGSRFRDQLKGLIERLDLYAIPPFPCLLPCLFSTETSFWVENLRGEINSL